MPSGLEERHCAVRERLAESNVFGDQPHIEVLGEGYEFAVVHGAAAVVGKPQNVAGPDVVFGA